MLNAPIFPFGVIFGSAKSKKSMTSLVFYHALSSRRFECNPDCRKSGNCRWLMQRCVYPFCQWTLHWIKEKSRPFASFARHVPQPDMCGCVTWRRGPFCPDVTTSAGRIKWEESAPVKWSQWPESCLTSVELKSQPCEETCEPGGHVREGRNAEERRGGGGDRHCVCYVTARGRAVGDKLLMDQWLSPH